MKNKEQNSSDALSKKQVIAIVITAIVILILWLLNLIVLIKHHSNAANSPIGDRGTFGDMFGAVNSLFSGLAFGGIIWTILLQRNELKLQREESKQSRDEAIEQNKTLRLQRFENTFFNMLTLQNEIVKSLQTPRFTGRLVISQAQKDLFAFLSIENYNKLNGLTNLAPRTNSLSDTPQNHSSARAMLDNFYHKKFYDYYGNSFNHYFRHLYHIFKFIYFSKLERNEKKFYAGLIRAQLSQEELYLISFNILMEDYGKPNFLFLTKEYDILQNFDWTDVNPIAFKELIEYELINVSNPFT
ncbi:MAG: hypothetical protein EOO91_01370 [Pedobacter sp.]|nr:MAG: hypothetical protein EOO91_01370 [Pedobacter sp.]